MGRRKIEIQPITHERNRSVTFLKRKNGLFKKAYELGVLCSVDVAVIIFEERPGHHVKLYQYGSSDIHDIVQKHLRHDGEKDTRGPPDFAGNSNNKLDDIGGDDEEDGEDDDEMPSRTKRRHDGKLKPDMVSGSMDYGSHRNVTVPQPPLSLHLSGQSGSGGTSLPISNHRDIPRDLGKRNRLTIGHSRSPSDNPNDPNSGPYAYHGSQSSGPFGGRSSGQYQHHGHHNQHHHSGSGYQPFFPHPHPSPPPSFIPLQADFPRGSVSSRGAASGGGGGGFGMPPRSNSGGSNYDNPAMYSSMVRTQAPGASQTSGPGASGPPNPDLFAAFLDADEQSRHQGQAQQGPGFVGLDWPVHGSGGGASAAPSGPPSSAVSNPSGASSAGPDPPGGNNPNWLDFLSGNNPNAANAPPPGSAPRGDSAMSWERAGGPGGGGDHHRGGPEIGDMFGGDRGRTAGGMGGKRKGEDDGPSSLASPASVNGGRDTKKDVG